MDDSNVGSQWPISRTEPPGRTINRTSADATHWLQQQGTPESEALSPYKESPAMTSSQCPAHPYHIWKSLPARIRSSQNVFRTNPDTVALQNYLLSVPMYYRRKLDGAIVI